MYDIWEQIWIMHWQGNRNSPPYLTSPIRLVFLFAVISSPGYAQTDIVSNNFEFQQHFRECFVPPKEVLGQHFSIRFSTNNNGVIIGHPFIFWFTLQNDPQQRTILEPLINKEMQKCFPLTLAAPLKDTTPGKVHVLEFNLSNQRMHIQD